MNIWIDLANSPHVLFFFPIVRECEKRGHTVFLTHREFAQTSRLCNIFALESHRIGVHGGQGIIRKFKNTFGRAMLLRSYAKSRKIDIAVSHNSYAHCLAAKSLRIRYITCMDYEHQPANHINFRLADEILVPHTFRTKDVECYGATENRLSRYPGLKEEVYLWQFRHDFDFWKREFPELNSAKVMCSIRPPATMAAYHNFENPIFSHLLEYLLSHVNLQTVFFPRTNEQGEEFGKRFPGLYIARKTVDGAQLIANSDLIISAGGTMNREAAVLGTPAYTVYAGKMGSVDEWLLVGGKLKFINSIDDLELIRIEKKMSSVAHVNRDVFDYVMQTILRSRTR